MEPDERVFPHKQIPEWARVSALRVQRQQDLRFEIPGSRLVASARSLQKMVDEVVGNAVKFSEPGTPVRIECREEPQMWRLDVSDRGRGMTPEQIADIGAFRQFDRPQYERKAWD
jgi:signal transduction histidine kinase